MENLQEELLFISKSISELASKVEKLAQKIEGEKTKKVPKKKTKAPAKVKPTTKKQAAKKATPKKPSAKKVASSGTGILDTIYGVISRSRKGVSVAQLREKTDFETRQVNNAIFKLKQKNRIEAISRGVYAKKKA
jgi:hypothetical protein